METCANVSNGGCVRWLTRPWFFLGLYCLTLKTQNLLFQVPCLINKDNHIGQ